MSNINPVKADFKRITDIYLNSGGTISIVFLDDEYDVYLLEVEGTITRKTGLEKEKK